MNGSKSPCGTPIILTFILRPYSRVNTENPYPILDLFPECYFLNLVHSLSHCLPCRFLKCHLQGNFFRLISSSNWLVSRKMIPYSRPKLSDFYTLFESKTIPFTAAHTYKAHIWEYPSPPGIHYTANDPQWSAKLQTKYFAQHEPALPGP